MENKINLTRGKWIFLLISAVVIGAALAKVAAISTPYYMKREKAVIGLEPKEVLLKVYDTANSYFKGDTMELLINREDYFSRHLMKAFNQHEGLLLYTLARETRNGSLKTVEILSQDFPSADSAIVTARTTFINDSTKTFDQPFVKEAGRWKIALKYAYDVK